MPKPQPAAAAPTRVLGQVDRIVLERGFGFIKGDDGQDYFFHYTELLNTELADLQSGESVSFEGLLTPKGYRANAVSKARE